jgi:hypothetical protein
MFKNSDNNSDTEVGHMCNGNHSERFPLRTCLSRVTDHWHKMKIYTVEKKHDNQMKSIQSSQGQRK